MHSAYDPGMGFTILQTHYLNARPTYEFGNVLKNTGTSLGPEA